MKLVYVGLWLWSLHVFAVMEGDKTPVLHPVVQMYQDLKAQGLTSDEILDMMLQSNQLQTDIVAFPIEECYKNASSAFVQNTKTCATFPKPQQSSCYTNSQNQLTETNRGCTMVHGAAAFWNPNASNTNNSSTSSTKKK